MRFKYSTLHPSQDEFDSLPRIPLVLRIGVATTHVVGLVDSGATVNVLPYETGLALGLVWDYGRANIRLAGNLATQPGIPVFAMTEIAGVPTVRLAFAWIRSRGMPVILGQTNFFLEFEVFFYRSRLEFEIHPRSLGAQESHR